MELLSRIEELEKELAELKELAKEEQDFPKVGDTYWCVTANGRVSECQWYKAEFDLQVQVMGNTFKTKEQAEFAVEKLKVEAELRKYSRPFKENENNYFIRLELLEKTIAIDSDEYFQTQGTVYFETTKAVLLAVDTIGEERIKKYIFGVED